MLPIQCFPWSIWLVFSSSLLTILVENPHAFLAILQYMNQWTNGLKNVPSTHKAFVIHFTEKSCSSRANCYCFVPKHPNNHPILYISRPIPHITHTSLKLSGRIPCHLFGIDLEEGFSIEGGPFPWPRCSSCNFPRLYA